MANRDLLIYGLTLACGACLCGFVYGRSVQRRLPFFALYASTILGGTLLVGSIYYYFGFRSEISYYAGWINVFLNLFTRCLAITELCRYRLRAYQGVWNLTWRLLAVLAVLFCVQASVDAWGQTDRLVIYGLVIERDLGISTVLILTAGLLVHTYYGLFFEALQKSLAAGLSLISLVDVFNNTTLHVWFTGNLSLWFHRKYLYLWPTLQPQVESANALWGAVRTVVLLVVTVIWCYALRKALPTTEQDPVLLPVEVYGTLIPAVNLRLRSFNDRLLELLRP